MVPGEPPFEPGTKHGCNQDTRAQTPRSTLSNRRPTTQTSPGITQDVAIGWTEVHRSQIGDLTDLTTHVASSETENTCYVIAGDRLVGEASYMYEKLDERMAIVICRPRLYRGGADIALYAMLDSPGRRTAPSSGPEGEPFAVADSTIREVPTARGVPTAPRP